MVVYFEILSKNPRMAPQPKIQPLPRAHRRLYFLSLLTIFIIGVPVLILLATGYRFENGTELISTGGIYVGSDRSGSEIYINDELVQETRIFRRGFYAQNLEPGVHHIHVQKEDHHTWVKEIVVVPHRVTEAQAFNLPLEPNIREIPRFVLLDGTPLFELSTTTASTTAEVLASTTVRVAPNSEHIAILDLFATTTATTSLEILDILTLVENELIATTTTEIATTSKELQDMKLFEKEEGLFAMWIGDEGDVPYYFCAIATSSPPSEAPMHNNDGSVIKARSSEIGIEIGTTTETVFDNAILEQRCRGEIQLGTNDEELIAFDFFPGNSDLALLLLPSGVYVEEIDDRGWQNIQPLYLKEDIDMRVLDGRIYIQDGEYLLEVLTET